MSLLLLFAPKAGGPTPVLVPGGWIARAEEQRRAINESDAEVINAAIAFLTVTRQE